MKKFVVKFISVGLAVLVLFFAGAFAVCFGLPGAYNNHYQRGYVYQYRYLESLKDERKIITIGSSNVAFGVDSNYLAELTGLPAVNLGLNAGTGISFMFDTAEKFIGEGDIVLFPFWPVTGEDYGYDLLWLTLDGETDLMADYVKSYPLETLSTIGSAAWRKVFRFTGDRLLERVKAALGGTLDEDIYTAASFDPATGSFIADRPVPIVTRAEMAAARVEYKVGFVNESTRVYLENYAAMCRDRGAAFYLVYPPVIEDALNNNTPENNAAVQAYMESVFSIPVIMEFSDCIYPYEYGYNLSTHLNSVGMEAYTKLLAECVKPYL